MTVETIRGEIRRLADLHDGELSARQVVEAAANPHSLLHPSFEWDNDHAAGLYRLWQARALLNSFEITYTRPDGTTNTVREFPSFRTSDGTRRYVPIERVAQDVTMIDILVDEFDRLLRHFAQRVDSHSDLKVRGRYQRVLTAISEVLAEEAA